jgi:tripartite-type tricarboxylate transporter receptor subunit TctC
MFKRTKWLPSLLCACAGVCLAPAARGVAADPGLFQGKVIEIVVCTKAGGSFDSDARLLAPYLQKELPGSTVIVRNVPGGGHIVGANRVWSAPKNGLTLGVANVPGLIAAQIRDEEGIQFDLRKFTWIGRMYSRNRFLVARRRAGFDTIDALLRNDKEFKIGCAGVGSGPYNTGLLAAEALRLDKVRMIPNYGGGETQMGILRKEIEGIVGGLETWEELIKQGEAAPILAFDARRYPGAPNVPTLTELVKTPRGKAIAAYIASESELARAVFAPPGLPPAITAALRTAFMKALSNEELKKLVAKMKRDPFDPLSGEEVAADLHAALDLPGDVRALIRQVAKEQE